MKKILISLLIIISLFSISSVGATNILELQSINGKTYLEIMGTDAFTISPLPEVVTYSNNLIENGNFESDYNADGLGDFWGIGVLATDMYINNNIQYWFSNNNSFNGHIKQNYTNDSSDLAGHLLYLSLEFENLNNIFVSDDTTYTQVIASIQNLTEISIIYNHIPYGIDKNSRLTFYSNDILLYSSVKNIILLDLTTIFGSGNEPTDTIQLDKMVAYYIDNDINTSDEDYQKSIFYQDTDPKANNPIQIMTVLRNNLLNGGELADDIIRYMTVPNFEVKGIEFSYTDILISNIMFGLMALTIIKKFVPLA